MNKGWPARKACTAYVAGSKGNAMLVVPGLTALKMGRLIESETQGREQDETQEAPFDREGEEQGRTAKEEPAVVLPRRNRMRRVFL